MNTVCSVVDIAENQGYVLFLLLGEVRKSAYVPQAGFEHPPASDSGILGLQTPKSRLNFRHEMTSYYK